jgi:hypothetical protein
MRSSSSGSSFEALLLYSGRFNRSYLLALSVIVFRRSGVKNSPKIFLSSSAYSPTTLDGRVLYDLCGLACEPIGEMVGLLGATWGYGWLGGQTEGCVGGCE